MPEPDTPGERWESPSLPEIAREAICDFVLIGIRTAIHASTTQQGRKVIGNNLIRFSVCSFCESALNMNATRMLVSFGALAVGAWHRYPPQPISLEPNPESTD